MRFSEHGPCTCSCKLIRSKSAERHGDSFFLGARALENSWRKGNLFASWPPLTRVHKTILSRNRCLKKRSMPKSQGSGQALVLSPDEANQIIEACSPAMRAVFSFARCTAARINEVLSLRWENVTPTCVVLPKRIVKGKKKTREVPVNDRLAAEVRAWREQWETTYGRQPEGSDFLFPGRGRDTKGKHLTRWAADKALRKTCKELEIEGASTHSWRRTSLSNANDAGISLRVLQAISGHSSLDVLSRYLQTSDTQKRQAANAFG